MICVLTEKSVSALYCYKILFAYTQFERTSYTFKKAFLNSLNMYAGECNSRTTLEEVSDSSGVWERGLTAVSEPTNASFHVSAIHQHLR